MEHHELSPEEERRLVERMANGDEDAMIPVYRAYANRVLGWMIKKGLPQADAEDQINEIFFEFWNMARKPEKPFTYHEKGGLGAPLWAIAQCKVWRWQRRRYANRLDLESQSEKAAKALSDEPVASDAEARLMLADAIDKLPILDFLLFYLHYVVGLDQATLAALFGWSLSKVNRKLKRIRHELREYMGLPAYALKARSSRPGGGPRRPADDLNPHSAGDDDGE